MMIGKEKRLVREGTIKWWDYVMSSVIESMLERRKNNFFANHEHHKYLYFLYHKYTFGANKYINEQLLEY